MWPSCLRAPERHRPSWLKNAATLLQSVPSFHSLQEGPPHERGDAEYPDPHQGRELKHGERQQVAAEKPEVVERAVPLGRHSDWPSIEDDPGGNADTREPLRIRHKIGAQRPAAMGRDLPPECRAPCQGGEQDDEYGIEAEGERSDNA